MAYTTSSAVKQYLGITGTGDDALIGYLVTRAQKFIDTYTQRIFESSADATRKFTVGTDTDGDTLYLDEDLCAITSVTNNADGSSPDSLTQNTDYIAYPRNTTPYHKLVMLSSSTYYWTYTTAAENGIEVVGRWAYSTTAPDDIKHACTRLAAFYYRQKDAQVFDTTVIPEAGVITAPTGIPADVKEILKKYMRKVY